MAIQTLPPFRYQEKAGLVQSEFAPSDPVAFAAGRIDAAMEAVEALNEWPIEAKERAAAVAALSAEDIENIAQASGFTDAANDLQKEAAAALEALTGRLAPAVAAGSVKEEAENVVPIRIAGEVTASGHAQMIATAQEEEMLAQTAAPSPIMAGETAPVFDEERGKADAKAQPEPTEKEGQGGIEEGQASSENIDRKEFVHRMQTAVTVEDAVDAIRAHASGSVLKSMTGPLATEDVVAAFQEIERGGYRAKMQYADTVLRETAARLIRRFSEKGIEAVLAKEVPEIATLDTALTPADLLFIFGPLSKEELQKILGERKADFKKEIAKMAKWAGHLKQMQEASEDPDALPQALTLLEWMPFRDEFEEAMRQVLAYTKNAIRTSDGYKNKQRRAREVAAAGFGSRRQAVLHH